MQAPRQRTHRQLAAMALIRTGLDTGQTAEPEVARLAA
jgi:hypothetical protein